MSQNTTRSDINTALQTLFETIPEMRAGQLVAAVGELCADQHGRDLWDANDSEFLEAIQRFQRNFEAEMTASGRKAD